MIEHGYYPLESRLDDLYIIQRYMTDRNEYVDKNKDVRVFVITI